MSANSLGLRLRPATIDDAAKAADLDTAREPQDPRDPVLMRHWWATSDATDVILRKVAERDGEIVALLAAGHTRWEDTQARFGWVRPRLHPDLWTADRFDDLVQAGEEWLRAEGAKTVTYRGRDYLGRELEVVKARGYREVRQERISELDLEAHRDDIVRTASETRTAMREQGIELLVYSELEDSEKEQKLYQLEVETEQDVPTTVPIPVISFEHWWARRFQDPASRLDAVWLAREGESLVGISQLSYPVVRGYPYTDYTATARSVRGRGIGRALKYQTVAQAVGLGFSRVRTANDGENAPILRINQEMGYELVITQIELHRELS